MRRSICVIIADFSRLERMQINRRLYELRKETQQMADANRWWVSLQAIAE
ncbi:MAG: hypothetical protein U0Y68_05855 [Blastocatellia bacterium]